MPTTEEKPVEASRKEGQEQPGRKSISERFSGREPRLDVVRFSAPWRPLARFLQPRAR